MFGYILPDTKQYLDAQSETISPGRLIDEAIKLHTEIDPEPPPKKTGRAKREKFGTTVAMETWSYVRSWRGIVRPGQVIDQAVALYRQANYHEETTA